MTISTLIQKQIIDVSCQGCESDGLAVQRKISALCNEQLTKSIERVLERLSSHDLFWRIDRIDLDLGTMNWENLDLQFSDVLAGKLEESTRNLNKGQLQGMSPQVAMDETSAAIGAFIFYLEMGRYPLSHAAYAADRFEKILVDSFSDNRIKQKFMGQLKVILAQHATRERFAMHVGGMLQRLIFGHFLTPRAARELLDLFNTLGEHRHEVFKEKIIQATLEVAVNDMEVLIPEIVSTAVYLLTIDGRSKARSYVENIRSGRIQLPKFHAEILDSLMRTTDSPSKLKPQVTSDVRRREIYIDDAGLALLHPFLPRLFELLGLTRKDELIDPEKVIQVLHYLATGTTTVKETELVFPKVLCGLSPEAVVSTSIELTRPEMDIADDMLKAVVEHWQVLQNSSIDSLRGTFLHRHGKLSSGGDGAWLLQVEKFSYDVLLNSLPWGIAMIKLPWMKDMLTVDWPN